MVIAIYIPLFIDLLLKVHINVANVTNHSVRYIQAE